MEAGQLTDIIKIYRPQVTLNEYGEQTTEMVFVEEQRAKVEFDSSTSRVLANQEITFIESLIMTMYLHANIQNYDHVEWNGKRYYITHIQDFKNTNTRKVYVEEINV